MSEAGIHWDFVDAAKEVWHSPRFVGLREIAVLTEVRVDCDIETMSVAVEKGDGRFYLVELRYNSEWTRGLGSRARRVSIVHELSHAQVECAARRREAERLEKISPRTWADEEKRIEQVWASPRMWEYASRLIAGFMARRDEESGDLINPYTTEEMEEARLAHEASDDPNKGSWAHDCAINPLIAALFPGLGETIRPGQGKSSAWEAIDTKWLAEPESDAVMRARAKASPNALPGPMPLALRMVDATADYRCFLAPNVAHAREFHRRLYWWKEPCDDDECDGTQCDYCKTRKIKYERNELHFKVWRRA